MFRLLDAAELERVCQRWLDNLAGLVQGVVAIDGKSVRGPNNISTKGKGNGNGNGNGNNGSVEELFRKLLKKRLNKPQVPGAALHGAL